MSGHQKTCTSFFPHSRPCLVLLSGVKKSFAKKLKYTVPSPLTPPHPQCFKGKQGGKIHSIGYALQVYPHRDAAKLGPSAFVELTENDDSLATGRGGGSPAHNYLPAAESPSPQFIIPPYTQATVSSRLMVTPTIHTLTVCATAATLRLHAPPQLIVHR